MKKLFLALLLVSGVAFGQATNKIVSPLVSAVQTATTVNSADQGNFYFQCAHFVVNVSAYTSGNYTPHIQGKDAVAGIYYDILVGPAISATGTTILKVCPGISPLANGASNDMLPGGWRVQLAGAATPSMTISVDALMDY